ncbi:MULTISPECIES: lipid asymmetry maintenance protein MlaB [Pantoea]|mgnify:CR=1 FL=1|jgi:phospholipid transport system transporter-binding protein|uniref:Lipid asymmetry maintenance protein MlaB n=1 Tax=Pantoea brenneri TaxID=472694 RepID=A0A653PJC6_9GAMM|nr:MULTISPECIES: lipid asymmetry maintenance protein MlaB [Pantoea]MXP50225.1 lipid asymmetry maintenance protein MlaB [Pantoea sp. Eser]KKD32035.1 anti-sigma B factor antagonist [Pantoea sp. 3.5.1]MBS6033502.1 lipid asymmetry maintenance protein MlaB [Pantoea sp.]MBZ6394585.1 lipid asymmetry maintenance protein MlaB [Pantoea sp.]MBZ6438829.1 lipid asymmetry maintenance protein MlaB [Pantoea sp.]
MRESLSWQREASTLLLKGELDRDTLLSLWQQRDTLIKDVDIIDVAALERVDSSGLALLVHLREIARAQGITPRFAGISDKLQSLITLYNLQQIIVSADKSA